MSQEDCDMIYLGRFKQTTTKMIVSDPCTKKEKCCVLENVKKGNWDCMIQLEDESYTDLTIVHNFEKIQDDQKFVWTWIDSIPVDSGQAGIFDHKYYQDNNNIDDNYDPNKYTHMKKYEDELEPWYFMCCVNTVYVPHKSKKTNHPNYQWEV